MPTKVFFPRTYSTWKQPQGATHTLIHRILDYLDHQFPRHLDSGKLGVSVRIDSRIERVDLL